MVYSNYPATRSTGQDAKFTVCLFLFVCMYGYEFLSRALPIGVKFCTMVQPDLGQVFSYFAGIAQG